MNNRDIIQGVVIIVVASVLFLGVITLVSGVGDHRGESQYSGVVVDFENERGFLFQTTQANMKTNPEATSHETFCVLDENRDEQVPVLREAARNGERVTITYERPRYVPVWECESGTSIITDIEGSQ